MNRSNWTPVVSIGVVLLILLIGGSLLPLSWGGRWGAWGGMMGPGMMGGWSGPGGAIGPMGWFFPLFGLLFPLAFLALLVLGGMWLFRQVNAPQGPATGRAQTVTGETCPSCGRAVQADWQVCPYCGQGLV
jgi:hypothetical protein